MIRTIMMEVDSEISREKLDELTHVLNTRLAGLTLKEIRDTFSDRLRDAQSEGTGLIRLFVDSVDKLFPKERTEKIHFGGAENVLEQPEFVNPDDFRSIIELINNEEIIIHVLEKVESQPREIRVTIGKENEEEVLKPYSVITTSYTLADMVGVVGVIGPKRMPYSRMIPLVDYVARTISEMFNNPRS